MNVQESKRFLINLFPSAQCTQTCYTLLFNLISACKGYSGSISSAANLDQCGDQAPTGHVRTVEAPRPLHWVRPAQSPGPAIKAPISLPLITLSQSNLLKLSLFSNQVCDNISPTKRVTSAICMHEDRPRCVYAPLLSTVLNHRLRSHPRGAVPSASSGCHAHCENQ